MKRIAMFLLAFLGITIVYFQDDRTGYVYVNNCPHNYMAIISEESNTCRTITDDPALSRSALATATEFLEFFKKCNPNGVRWPAKRAVITPNPEPAPPPEPIGY